MGSFSDLFCLRPESLCGCGWEKFLISLWEPRSRIFEGVWWKLSQVPPLHMGLSKRGRAFEPWEKNHDTLPSICDVPSLLLRSSKDHIWSSVPAHILQVRAHEAEFGLTSEAQGFSTYNDFAAENHCPLCFQQAQAGFVSFPLHQDFQKWVSDIKL